MILFVLGRISVIYKRSIRIYVTTVCLKILRTVINMYNQSE